MVITSFGINKSQKKFAPKQKPKVTKKEANKLTSNENAATEVITNESTIDINGRKINELTTTNQIDEMEDISSTGNLEQSTFKLSQISISKSNLISSSKIIQAKGNNTSIEESLSESRISLEEKEIVKPKSKINKLIEKPKGNAIMTPAFNPVKSQSKTKKSIGEEEDTEEDIPLDIMANYGHKENQQKKKRKSKSKVNSMPAQVTQISNVEEDINTINGALTNGTLESFMGLFPRGNEDNPDNNEDIMAQKILRFKPRQKARYAKIQLDKMGEKKRKVDMNTIPLDALCAPHINYGEEMSQELKNKFENAAMTVEKRQAKETENLLIEKEIKKEKAGQNKGIKIKEVNGEFIIDQSSLHITHAQLVNKNEPEILQVEHLGEMGNHGNSSQFVKKSGNKRWSEWETDLFYKGLVKWGTDFEMIAKEFNNRSRRQIKLKYIKEDAVNSHKVTQALTYRNYESLF
ncbi:hypothetical protein K502DRAFT_323314 [Neoconidiobolus thromboides FSU 785]|nr:hypothetical protein K502DRAFT_323314 [Neoconidiobolus thromboides FSU 785]